VTWEARHFGIRQRLTARISRFERPAVFEDTQVRGPFASFRHVHEFVPRPGGTEMIDTFTFASPLGPIGEVFDRVVLTAYMRRFLRARADALKAMAERPRSRGPASSSP
jgi:ligand-binding SRPBCC domain-containing protein